MKMKLLAFVALFCVFGNVVESRFTAPPTFLTYKRFRFSSPDYPRDYPNNTRCAYNIIAPESHFIVITFNDFQLYDENDYIEIVEEFEGNWAKRSKRGISISSVMANGTAVQIQRPDSSEVEATSNNYGQWVEESEKVIRKEIRGPQKTPFRYVTERSVVSITFVSDATYSAKGFNASYAAIPYTKRCVRKLMSDDEGSFINHRSPSGFPPNAKCSYFIRVKKGKFIELKFAPSLPFNFYDRIEIRSGVGDKRLYHSMDALAFKLNFTTNVVSIQYIGDRSTMGGFTISYRTFSKADICKDNSMKGMQGTFSSPGYPNLYPFGVECDYTIEVEKGYHIEITFNLFHLSVEGENRVGDYLEITDIGAGNDRDKVVHDRSRYTPLKYVSESNLVGLKFFSDAAKLWKAEGFTATYKAMKNIECGSDVFVVTCGKFNCSYTPNGAAKSCQVTCDENYKRVGKKVVKCGKAVAADVPKCVLDEAPFRLCLQNMRNPDCPHSYERVADYFTDPDEEGREDFPREEVYASKADINSKAFANYIRRSMGNQKEECDHRLCDLNTMTKNHSMNCRRYATEKLARRQYKKSMRGPNLRAKNKLLRHCLKCQYMNCRTRG